MGRRRRVKISFATFWFAILLVSAASLVACHHDASDQVDEAASASAQPATPVDHLAPGELIEGKENAFGVPLPRELPLERQFTDVAYAAGAPPEDAVAKYFSTRVQGGKVTTGDRGATFEGVHTAAAPTRTLRIEVATWMDGPYAGRGSRVTIRDITPPQVPDLPDEEARWKAAGLKPDGTLADPQHLK